MSKGILGPAIVSCCLIGTGCFHYYSTIGRQQYTDANKSVSELLSQNHFQAVSFDSSADGTWSKIVDEYMKDQITDTERFTAKTGTKEDIKEQLKKDCQEIINKPTSSLTTYNKAIRWCVVPQTAKARLQSKGKVPLEMSKDKATWIGIAKQYQEKKVKIEGFTLDGKTDDALAQEMNKGCEALFNVNNWDKNYETKAERTEKLCSKKQ